MKDFDLRELIDSRFGQKLGQIPLQALCAISHAHKMRRTALGTHIRLFLPVTAPVTYQHAVIVMTGRRVIMQCDGTVRTLDCRPAHAAGHKIVVPAPVEKQHRLLAVRYRLAQAP